MSEELNSIRIQRAEYWPGIAHSSMTGILRAGCVPHKFSASPTVVLAFTKQRTSQSLPFHGFDNTIVYPKNPECCRLHRPPDHRRGDEGRATARAEIVCEDAFFAHTAIIGAIDVGQWHADRRKEDIWFAFCSPAGWRNHIF